MALLVTLAGCGDDRLREACKPQTRPEPTAVPGEGSGTPWLGRSHGGLDFYRGSKGGSHYGEPLPGEWCSGGAWHFGLSIAAYPRRPETVARLRRSLGRGQAFGTGRRYGCLRPLSPARIVIVDDRQRIEITGGECPALERAALALRRA